MLVREIETKDAENLINLIREVEAHSPFMLMETGERKTTTEQQLKQIVRMKATGNSTIFVIEVDECLIGYLFLIGGSVKRTKHSAYIAVGLLKDYRGKGVGTALFEKAEEWARNHGITRLELTAVKQNEAGVALYKKRGFEIEGTKRNSLNINGQYFDEFYMSKLLL
jgi:RimJ/RimL family protein N-acetyltransferase